jgi:hypothetical protein
MVTSAIKPRFVPSPSVGILIPPASSCIVFRALFSDFRLIFTRDFYDKADMVYRDGHSLEGTDAGDGLSLTPYPDSYYGLQGSHYTTLSYSSDVFKQFIADLVPQKTAVTG